MLIDLSLPIAEANPFTAGSPVAHLGHIGTHLDRSPTQELTPDRFICTGSLIDVSTIRDCRIEPPDLVNIAEIEPGDFVVIRTGWLAERYPSDEYFQMHPELSQEAVELIVSKEVNRIGIDAPGLGRPDRHSDLDRFCAEHDVFVVENLANLERLTTDAFKIYCFPINLTGSSGLPVRVVAEF